MNREKLVIRDNSTLRTEYDNLQAGDIVIGRLRLRVTEESLLADLITRQIHLIPSGLSQLASRSKTLQTVLFGSYMLPHTRAIHDQHDLIETISAYNENSIARVVTKLDRSNAGTGVFLWQNIEEVFTHASIGSLPFPFVLQPYVSHCHDIRVVFLGEYIEAYRRHNRHNFRNNLHHGGRSQPCDLSEAQLTLCRRVLERGNFPYGHLDLLVTQEGNTFLTEINLRGGIRGAVLTPAEYQAKVAAIHQEILNRYIA